MTHDEYKKRVLARLSTKMLPRHLAWRRGDGPITMSPTHPLADMKPREQFLLALNRVAPEVRLTLDEVTPIYRRAIEHRRKFKGFNELDDWGEVKAAAGLEGRCTTGDREPFMALYTSLKAWAERLKLDEPNWTYAPAWLLDEALGYLEHAPLKYFSNGVISEGQKTHFPPRVQQFHFSRAVPPSALQDRNEVDYMEYMTFQFQEELKKQLENMKQYLDSVHGGALQKKQPMHFDWVALKHLFGYSAETIGKAMGIDAQTVNEAIRQCAGENMLGLKLQKLPPGRRKHSAHSDEDDVRRRLNLV